MRDRTEPPTVSLVAGILPAELRAGKEDLGRTYRIAPGPPLGKSYAQEIAERHGMGWNSGRGGNEKGGRTMPVMTGSRCLARTLRGYGVSHVFLVPAIFFSALAELDDLGVRVVVAHSELAAAYMADGYARASRRPGVCLAQAVGAANLAAGLRDAHLASSPVLAFTGGPDPATRYRHLYQEIEDFSMFDPVTKLNLRVETVQMLPDLLRQAFRVATTGTPGPVHLEIPGRLGQALDEKAELEPLVEERFSHYPAYRPEPEDSYIREAAQVLARAERPVIVAGGGVVASDAARELVALAETLSIPVATSLNAKEVIPEDHPLSLGIAGTYGRWATNQAVKEADLVFFVGSRAGGHVTDNWKAPRPGTPVLQLDIAPDTIGHNYPVEVGLLGDARATLRRLLEAVKPASPRVRWLRRVQELKESWWAQVLPLAHSDRAPIRPERLCREIGEVLPPDAVLVADTGHAAFWSGTMVALRRPTQRYIRCAGTLGWGLPGAIGAKCALPDRPVLCLTGDGGLYYHMAELETAVRLGIKIVTVVINNRSLRQTKSGWDAAYGSQSERARPLWVFHDTDFAKIAESMGGAGSRVEEPRQLRPTLEAAFTSDRPVVIDVVCDIEAVPPPPWPEA